MTHEESVESILESLYLTVPGTELDRLRLQLMDGFRDSKQFKSSQDVIIMVGNQNCFYAYTVNRQIAKDIRESMPAIPPDIQNTGISQYVQHIVERLRGKVETGASAEHPVFTEELDALMIVGLLIKMMEGEGRNMNEQPRSQLILISLGFRTLENRQRAMFVATWRKGGLLS